MSVKSSGTLLIKGTQYGNLTVKKNQSLPNAGSFGNIFQNPQGGGGLIMVHALVGVVSGNFSATVTNVSLGTSSTNPTSIATATAVTSVTIGSLLIPAAPSAPATPGALIVTSGGVVWPPSEPFVIPTVFASTNIGWKTDATNSGTVTWYCWWTPIDSGAALS